MPTYDFKARMGPYLYDDNLSEVSDTEQPGRYEEGETPGRHGGYSGAGYDDPWRLSVSGGISSNAGDFAAEIDAALRELAAAHSPGPWRRFRLHTGGRFLFVRVRSFTEGNTAFPCVKWRADLTAAPFWYSEEERAYPVAASRSASAPVPATSYQWSDLGVVLAPGEPLVCTPGGAVYFSGSGPTGWRAFAEGAYANPPNSPGIPSGGFPQTDRYEPDAVYQSVAGWPNNCRPVCPNYPPFCFLLAARPDGTGPPPNNGTFTGALRPNRSATFTAAQIAASAGGGAGPFRLYGIFNDIFDKNGPLFSDNSGSFDAGLLAGGVLLHNGGSEDALPRVVVPVASAPNGSTVAIANVTTGDPAFYFAPEGPGVYTVRSFSDFDTDPERDLCESIMHDTEGDVTHLRILPSPWPRLAPGDNVLHVLTTGGATLAGDPVVYFRERSR